MDPFKRTIYLLALNELGQITSAEIRKELTATLEQMKADPASQPETEQPPQESRGY